jgi:hypothetical protein
VFPFVVNELGRLGPRANELMSLMWKHAETNGMKPADVQKLRNEFYSTLSCVTASSSMKSVAAHLSRLCYDKWKQQQHESKSERLELEWLDKLKSSPTNRLQALQQQFEHSIPANMANHKSSLGQFAQSAVSVDLAASAAAGSSADTVPMDDDVVMADRTSSSTCVPVGRFMPGKDSDTSTAMVVDSSSELAPLLPPPTGQGGGLNYSS